MADSALQHLAERLAAGSVPGVEGVQLSGIALPVKINLRGDPADAAFRQGVRTALGLEPADQANTFTRNGEVRCLWLGPDEWLIVAAAGTAVDLVDRLRAALAGKHISVVDVSAAYAALRLAGRRAREVLAKACPLDLHPRTFRPGHCAQSHFARTQAIVVLEDDAPVFHLFVRRSLAAYLAEWLLDAMREYHVEGSGPECIPDDTSHDAAESSNEAKGASIESLRRSLWARRRRVFISSTSLDLQELRAAVAQVVRDAGMEVLTMEQFPAMAADACGGSLTMIRRCRLFVGLYARRYGTTDAQGRSITELEYEEAKARNLPRICFLLAAHADWPAQLVEPDPGASKLETLKRRIRQDVIVKEFASLSELEAQARAALHEYLGKEHKRSRRRGQAVLAALFIVASSLLAWRAWSHTDHFQIRAVVASFTADPAFRTLGMDTDPGRWLAEAARAGRVRDAVRAADALGDTGARVLALARLGPEVSRVDGTEAAAVVAERAVELANQLEYAGNRWPALLALADAHERIGLRAAAGLLLGDAEKAARGLDYAEGRAPALTQIGLAHLRFGNKDAARDAALLAMKESLAIQDDAGRARALAEVLPLLGSVADAKTTADAAEEAVRVAEGQADPMQRSVVLAQAAKGLVAAGQLDLAAETVDASIAAIQLLPGEKLRNLTRFTALTSLLEGGRPADRASVALAPRLADRISSAGLRARGQAHIAALSADGQVREASTARAFDALASLRGDPLQQLTVAAQMAEIFTLAGGQDAASKAADVALQLILRDPLNASSLDVFGQTALALTQADRRAEAEEIVDVGLAQAYQWDGAKERSKLLSTMAQVMTQWGDLRGARLVALECTEPLDRFEAFAAILTAYADSAEMQ